MKSQPIIRLPDSPIESNDFKEIVELDLSPSSTQNYQLVNIEAFENQEYKNVYKKLQSLNLSKNSLPILRIRGYLNMTKLIASQNQIMTLDLILPKLTHLDLSQNKLTKMFDLMNTPSLQELNLSKNQITQLPYEPFKYVKSSLRLFDISENLLEFKTVNEFLNFADSFGGSMKELQYFQICKNPFEHLKAFKECYEDYMTTKFSHLIVLNFRIIDKQKQKSQKVGETSKEKMLEIEKEMRSNYQNLVNTFEERGIDTVNLKVLNNFLLHINQIGSLTEESLTKLENLVKIYSDTQDKKEDDGGEDIELDQFEELLDYIEKIIDSDAKYEDRIYKIIAKFGLIRDGKFSQRAFASLKQRITGKNDKSIKTALYEIYQFLYSKRNKEKEIPPKILEGLYLFLDEYSFIHQMKKILISFLEIQDKIWRVIVEEEKEEKSYEYRLMCGIINFMSSAFEYNNYLSELISKDNFIMNCVDFLKKILAEPIKVIIASELKLRVYKDILYIFRRLFLILNENEEQIEIIKVCKYLTEDEKNKKLERIQKQCDQLTILTNKVLGKGLRDRIEQKLRFLLQELFVPEDLSGSQKDMLNKKFIFCKKEICVCLIQCYGALLSKTTDIAKFLDNKSLLCQILDILGQNEIIDPMLIKASCDLCLWVLYNKKINTDEKKLSIIASKLYNFRCLIPLLTPDSQEFFTVCEISEKYNFKAIDRGKPINTKYLNSPMINDMVISISTLMSFFGKFSQGDTTTSTICKDICNEMRNLDRDKALAASLLLPDETVKLNIVNCIFSFEVEKLSSDELASIYKQLINLSSLSPKMQIIVAIIYLIINKWFLYNLTKKEYSKIDACKEAISIAINLLYKNDITRANENMNVSKKKNLSSILIVFLINVSCFQITKKYFSESKYVEEMNLVIASEQKSGAFYTSATFPLEIEKCHLGWNIVNLMGAISTGKIDPYNYVSLRILHHIGDTLFNYKYPCFEIDYSQKYEQIMSFLGEDIQSREEQRIKTEQSTWSDEEEIYSIKEKDLKCSVKLDDKEVDKEQKNFIKYFDTLLNFVLARNSDKQITNFSKVWEDKFYKYKDMFRCDRVEYSTFDVPKDKKEYGSKYEEEKPVVPEEDKLPPENESNIFSKFKDFLRTEDYEIEEADDIDKDFNYIKEDIYFYQKYGLYGCLERNTQKGEETPNNPYLRSLFISAFLRCIYAILKSPKSRESKNELIKKLFEKDNIRTISLLAESTTFAECNIASKYLGVMKYVLQNSSLCPRKDDKPNEFLRKLGQIAFIMQHIIVVFKKDLTIDNKDHNILLTELCECASLIINQLQTIKFIDSYFLEKTISTMINLNLIQVLISMIKEFMNKDIMRITDETSPKDLFANDLLKNLINNSLYILSEYLSLNKMNKYYILEALTRSYTFENCKMRKLFISEILKRSKLAQEKRKIPGNPIQICECDVNVYEGQDDSQNIHWTNCHLIIQNLKVTVRKKDISHNIFSNKSSDGDIEFEIKNILIIFMSNYINKVWVKAKRSFDEDDFDICYNYYEILFFNSNDVSKFISNLTELNIHIKVFENLFILPSEKLAKEQKELVKNEDAKGNDKFVRNKAKQKINNETPLINDDEEENNVEIPLKIRDNKGAIILVQPLKEVDENVKKMKSFVIDSLRNLTKMCGQFIPISNNSYQLIVIQDNKLTLYNEQIWDDYNPYNFLKNIENKSPNKFYDITYIFKSIFIAVKGPIDIKDITSIQLDIDVLSLKSKDGKKIIEVKLFDDISYIRIRELIHVNDAIVN